MKIAYKTQISLGRIISSHPEKKNYPEPKYLTRYYNSDKTTKDIFHYDNLLYAQQLIYVSNITLNINEERNTRT
jgi:hypothetical protein